LEVRSKFAKEDGRIENLKQQISIRGKWIMDLRAEKAHHFHSSTLIIGKLPSDLPHINDKRDDASTMARGITGWGMCVVS
jgi:hypothetical protein